jgi:transposase
MTTTHVKGLLHKLLDSVMHKKRLKTLVELVETAIHSKRLSLTELGRQLNVSVLERSAVRKVDRFLGNKHLYEERFNICKKFLEQMVGNRKQIEILVDWTAIPNTRQWALRAALILEGRALPIYEEVHSNEMQQKAEIQRAFLKRLKEVLPSEIGAIIIGDAGFTNTWMRDVQKLGWDFICRVRGIKSIYLNAINQWKSYKEMQEMIEEMPTCHGAGTLCKSNALKVYFYSCKRKSFNHAKKRSQKGKYFFNSVNEGWLLASSLPEEKINAKKVVALYGKRMQIEEGFRDLKSSQYGLSFENAYSKQPKRIEILLLIGMLASWVAWLTGWCAEKKNLHRQFQISSYRDRRVLSLFYLGCQVIRRAIDIPIRDIKEAIQAIASYSLLTREVN